LTTPQKTSWRGEGEREREGRERSVFLAGLVVFGSTKRFFHALFVQACDRSRDL